MFSRTDDAGAVAPNAVRRSEPRSPAGMCRQARGTASAGRAATIPAPVFLLPRKTLRETDGRCRQKRRCHATWARLGVKRAFFPAGTTYLARRTAIHGLERTWGTTCVLRTYFYGRSARLLSIYPIYSLKIFKAYGSSLYRRKGLAGLRRKIGNAGRTGPAAGTPVRAEDGQQLNRLAGRMSCAGSQQADAAILPGAGTDPVLQRRRKVFLPGKRRRGVPRIENRT